jgi:trehalose 6-phosphate synthase
VPRRVEGLGIDLVPLALSRAEVQAYYYGFSNRTLWPLFHDLIEEPVIERRWWRVYQEVNQRFAETAADLDIDDPLLWVQDYHLLLLPELLRGARPGSPIGFFLHIPFPPPELMARLPWREELLKGMLGADVVGFHTERYRDNFVRSVVRVFPDAITRGKRILLPEGRRVRTSATPISIDVDEFGQIATSQETQRELDELHEQFAGRRVLLGVDRLDYTKGVRHRLQAIELLLERREDLRRQLTFVQIAVPSREDVKEYRELREDVEQIVGKINGRFTEPGHDVPVHYFHRGVTKPRLAAYYRLADVMLVTPLKDGMNLVAKEFCVCQDAGGEAGALVLSEFTGAALELTDAVSCNPFDVEGLSYRIEQALELDERDRRSRIQRMAAAVRRQDVYAWVDSELGALESAAGRR